MRVGCAHFIGGGMCRYTYCSSQPNPFSISRTLDDTKNHPTPIHPRLHWHTHVLCLPFKVVPLREYCLNNPEASRRGSPYVKKTSPSHPPVLDPCAHRPHCHLRPFVVILYSISSPYPYSSSSSSHYYCYYLACRPSLIPSSHETCHKHRTAPPAPARECAGGQSTADVGFAPTFQTRRRSQRATRASSTG